MCWVCQLWWLTTRQGDWSAQGHVFLGVSGLGIPSVCWIPHSLLAKSKSHVFLLVGSGLIMFNHSFLLVHSLFLLAFLPLNSLRFAGELLLTGRVDAPKRRGRRGRHAGLGRRRVGTGLRGFAGWLVWLLQWLGVEWVINGDFIWTSYDWDMGYECTRF